MGGVLALYPWPPCNAVSRRDQLSRYPDALGYWTSHRARRTRYQISRSDVGQNLIDHPMFLIIAKPVPGVVHDRDIVTPLLVRYTAAGSNEFNDMQLGVAIFFDTALAPGLLWPVQPPLFIVFAILQRPRSRGFLRLTTADPNVPAEISLNFMDHPEDMRRMAEGARIAWRVMRDSHLSPYVKEIIGLTHEAVDSNSVLSDFIRDNCTTGFHPVGTARMGPESDPMAVVDQYCRVRGVKGLRAWPMLP
jgi:choline dehydrogenase